MILFGSCPIAAATERSCANISVGEINPLFAASAIFFTTSLKSLNCDLVSNTRASAVGTVGLAKSRSLTQALNTGGAFVPFTSPKYANCIALPNKTASSSISDFFGSPPVFVVAVNTLPAASSPE